jgi:high affinity Mn2+ porin
MVGFPRFLWGRRTLRHAVGPVALFAALLASTLARAQDPESIPQGFYAGGHVGYMFGNATATLADPIGFAAADGTSQISTLFGGAQVGYEHVFPSHLMLGVELDASFTDYMEFSQILSYRFTPVVSANEQLEFLSTLRGRVGYSMGSWTPYLTGGLALASLRTELLNSGAGLDDVAPGNWRLGYAVGAGVDKALDKRWSARAEYLYTALGLAGFSFNPQARYDSQYDFQRFRIGLNYHFGVDADDNMHDGSSDDRGPGTWEIHGQTTFVYQGYPAFFSAIPDGPQSLPSLGQSRDTWTTSLFLFVRLWKGAELYFNPELLQGFGLGNTTGAAGFPNGEAQKSNFPYPRYSTSRLFLRQEIGLGGETEKVESDYDAQMSGVKDINRITFQIGRFAVHDFFDRNIYAREPRADFMNWSIWAAGAFDYAADKIGLTYGVTAALNQKNWAIRAGYFLVGDHPNSNVYDLNLFTTGDYVAELELRYKLGNRPGVARFGGWMHETFSGNYNDALNLVSTGLDADDAIAQVSHVQAMWGYYINLQQELADNLGAFARWSWNDGQSQNSAFTDINASLSGGLSIKGARWGRPDDTVGVGAAVNFISAPFASFLAQGGTGLLIGDGSLNYSAERVLELYYALHVTKGVTVTADYQYLGNPAYNADRGPVNVLSGRLHVVF